MYVRRKYRNKRKLRRRRPVKRRTAIAKKVNVKSDTHYFKRNCYKATIAGDVSRTAKGAFTFQLNDLPGSADFTQLFDYYKLTGVKLRFQLNLDPGAQTAANSTYPRMFYAIDHDDAQNPTDSNELRQRGKCRQWLLNPNKPMTVFLRPKYLNLISYNAIQNGYQIGKQSWLDLGIPDLPHYAFKYVIENLNPDIGQTVLVDATYYLAMKGTR